MNLNELSTLTPRERLVLDKKDQEFELKQVSFEAEALDIARWRKLKELMKRKNTAEEMLQQTILLLEAMDQDEVGDGKKRGK